MNLFYVPSPKKTFCQKYTAALLPDFSSVIWRCSNADLQNMQPRAACYLPSSRGRPIHIFFKKSVNSTPPGRRCCQASPKPSGFTEASSLGAAAAAAASQPLNTGTAQRVFLCGPMIIYFSFISLVVFPLQFAQISALMNAGKKCLLKGLLRLGHDISKTAITLQVLEEEKTESMMKMSNINKMCKYRYIYI